MDQRTRRIIKKTLINLSKLFAFVGSCAIYMITCIWLSKELSGDIYYGMAAFFVPMMIAAVWDQSKSQIDSEIYNEERTIQTLSRKYE